MSTPRPTAARPSRTRDYALVALIKGATKAAIHIDRRKAASKKACRRPINLHP